MRWLTFGKRTSETQISLSTVAAEAVWVVLAILMLLVRDATPPDIRAYVTLVVLSLCAVALGIAVKDSLVGPKWAWRLNVAALSLPLLLLVLLLIGGLQISNAPAGDPLWEQDLRPF